MTCVVDLLTQICVNLAVVICVYRLRTRLGQLGEAGWIGVLVLLAAVAEHNLEKDLVFTVVEAIRIFLHPYVNVLLDLMH